MLLARDADTGVVIRRGPSKRVCTIGWQRDTDRFELGQWLKARIYERRCDLSPDGRHLLYFAMNGRWASEAKGAWSAISQAPYLKASTLLAKGDCWHGGGLFLSNRDYWLNDGYGHTVLRDASGLKRAERDPQHASYGGECPGVYYLRLQRDGWTLRDAPTGTRSGTTWMFEKRINAHWQLRKFAHAGLGHAAGRGCYYDEHALWHPRAERLLPLPDWEWADVDRGRLVWAEHGVLSAGFVAVDGLRDVRVLFDFRAMRYERRLAPY